MNECIQVRKCSDPEGERRRRSSLTNIEKVVDTIMEDISNISFLLPHHSQSTNITEDRNQRAKRSWRNKKSISNQETGSNDDHTTADGAQRRLYLN